MSDSKEELLERITKLEALLAQLKEEKKEPTHFPKETPLLLSTLQNREVEKEETLNEHIERTVDLILEYYNRAKK